MNISCVAPGLYRGYLSHWKQANTISQGLLHTKNPIYAWGSIRIRVLAHTFHAQPLMCIPACLDPSSVTGYLTCSMSMPCFNATTRLLHMTPYRYTQAATDGNPQGILPIHTTDFPLLQCPLLALGSLLSVLNAEEKLSLLNPWSMSSCTAFLHSLNKSVIIWLQYDLHITLSPCHFTRWIGNLRTSQERTLPISSWCSFPEH